MTASTRALELAKAAAAAADDKLAKDVLIIDVSSQLPLTDVFVLASGANDPQIGAIVDSVEEKLHAMGAKPVRREGNKNGHWQLVDFGEIVVHVFHSDEREFYALERLWRDCPTVPWEA